MAVTGVGRIHQGVRYSERFEPRKGVLREFTDVWQVKIDDPFDSGKTALAAVGLPQFGQVHSEDNGAWVVSREASQDGRLRYIVSVGYSSQFPEDQQETNPLDEPVKRRWRTVKVGEKPAVTDRNGRKVLNKAGIQYDPPLIRRSSHVVLEFLRNEADFDGSTALQFVDKVNSGAFAGADPRTLLLDEIVAEENFKNDIHYWAVTYVFEFNPDGWDPEVLEQSLIELADRDGNGPGWWRILDNEGEPVTQPVPIDSSGAAIDPTTLPGSAVTTVWEIAEEINFGGLTLPQT